jgi:hypothetical protein
MCDRVVSRWSANPKCGVSDRTERLVARCLAARVRCCQRPGHARGGDSQAAEVTLVLGWSSVLHMQHMVSRCSCVPGTVPDLISTRGSGTAAWSGMAVVSSSSSSGRAGGWRWRWLRRSASLISISTRVAAPRTSSSPGCASTRRCSGTRTAANLAGPGSGRLRFRLGAVVGMTVRRDHRGGGASA